MKDFWGVKAKGKSKGKGKFEKVKTIPVETTTKFDFKLSNKRKPFLPKKPNKNMTFKQARDKFRISPFGDWDKDKILNIYDCRPFDWRRHKVPEEHKDRPVRSWFTEKIGPSPFGTSGSVAPKFSTIFSEAEEQMPEAFKDKYETEYSAKLTKALLKREEYPETPFKDIVGVYEAEAQVGFEQTQIAHQYLERYLGLEHPDKRFIFDVREPSKVDVMDLSSRMQRKKDAPVLSKDENIAVSRYISGNLPDAPDWVKDYVKKHYISLRGKVKKGERLGNYISKSAPKPIKDLLSLLNPYTKMKIVISDYPVDILRKSTHQDWTSCERVNPLHSKGRGEYEEGPFSDIAYSNAVAWFYFSPRQPEKDRPSGRVMLRWGTVDGTRTGKPDIGLEYVPEETKTVGSRGWYGSISHLAARPVVGELQKILKSKGYYSHEIKTPYDFRGYSDVMSGSGVINYELYPTFEPKYFGEEKVPKEGYLKGVTDVPEPLQHHFVHEPSVKIRRELAKKTGLVSPVQFKLASSPELEVKKELARQEKLEPDVISLLIKDPSLRTEMAGRDDLTDDLIEELLKYEDSSKYFAGKGNFPKKYFDKLLNHKNSSVRAIFAKRYDITNRMAEVLAKDVSAEVRKAVLSNKNVILSKTALINLAGDSDSSIRSSISTMDDLPYEAMLILAGDKEPSVVVNIARMKGIDERIIQKIIDSGDVWIVQELLDNGSISEWQDDIRILMLGSVDPRNKDALPLLTKILKEHISPKIGEYMIEVLPRLPEDLLTILASNTNIASPIRYKLISELVAFNSDAVNNAILNNSTVDSAIKELMNIRKGE